MYVYGYICRNDEIKILEDKLQERIDNYHDLNCKYIKLNAEYVECSKKLNTISDLTKTIMEWRQDTKQKKFIYNYVNDVIIPYKDKMKLKKLFLFWKSDALTKLHRNYDNIWKKRVETLSKKLISEYETCIVKLRNELNDTKNELKLLKTQRYETEQNMKRAFMRSVCM